MAGPSAATRPGVSVYRERMVHERTHFDADPATCYAMLTDPSFHRGAMEATGALEHDVEVTAGDEPGDARTVTTRRTLPTDGVPANLRRFVPSTLLLRQRTTWSQAGPDGTRTARTRADIEAGSTAAEGTMALLPANGGTDLVVDLDITCRIPLMGGRVVSAAEPLVVDGLRAEHEAGRRWLAGER